MTNTTAKGVTRKNFWHQALGRARGRPLKLLAICAAWAVVFAFLGSVVPLAPLELAEHSLQDSIVRHGLKNPATDRFVFLALDEASLDLSQLEPEEIAQSRALGLMHGEFPWSRAVYAEILEKVLGAGAQVVVLDVHFPARAEGDAEMREALQTHGSRAVIASLFEDTGTSQTLASQYRPPSDSVLPSDYPGGVVGFASFWPEPDKVVRGAHYRVSDALLLGELNLTKPQLRGRKSGHAGERRDSLAAVALRKAGAAGGIPDAGLIRFGEPGSFTVVPLYSIFVPAMWKANLRNGEIFRDKIVLLGPLAGRFRDHFRTPVGTLPGPEIHLHAMAAAAAGAFYTRASPFVVALTCLLLGLLAWIVSVALKRPLVALGVTGGALVLYAGAALALYNHASFLPSMLYPSLTLLLAGLTSFGYDFALERREKARVRRSLERYVSRDVVKDLLDHESTLLGHLGGVRKDVAVLFSDVRGFTALTERADPEILVAQLNEYLGEMVRIVFANSGTLDKFIGDAVMAVWGTVTTDGARGDCLRAARSALAMLGTVEAMRRRWKAEARADLRLGIGINFGPAVFGNIGSDEKMEPTVIGDAVNLASRLEGVTKKYGVPIVMSGAVADEVRGEIPLRTLDIVRVSGRSAPVEIYTVPLDDNAQAVRPPWLDRHEEGWALYRAGRFAEAADCFADLSPGGEGGSMLERCRRWVAKPPGPDWEPVTNLESK
ncbi:MAG: CHASE2 domain-containing protein [Chthoniobacterales bacterium]